MSAQQQSESWKNGVLGNPETLLWLEQLLEESAGEPLVAWEEILSAIETLRSGLLADTGACHANDVRIGLAGAVLVLIDGSVEPEEDTADYPGAVADMLDLLEDTGLADAEEIVSLAEEVLALSGELDALLPESWSDELDGYARRFILALA